MAEHKLYHKALNRRGSVISWRTQQELFSGTRSYGNCYVANTTFSMLLHKPTPSMIQAR